jgi:hypothetical protein
MAKTPATDAPAPVARPVTVVNRSGSPILVVRKGDTTGEHITLPVGSSELAADVWSSVKPHVADHLAGVKASNGTKPARLEVYGEA